MNIFILLSRVHTHDVWNNVITSVYSSVLYYTNEMWINWDCHLDCEIHLKWWVNCHSWWLITGHSSVDPWSQASWFVFTGHFMSQVSWSFITGLLMAYHRSLLVTGQLISHPRPVDYFIITGHLIISQRLVDHFAQISWSLCTG